MGLRVHYVGRKQQYRSFEQNISFVSGKYPVINGYFGVRGSSNRVREIHSRDHEATAKDFSNSIAKGGILDIKTIKGGVIARFSDGTLVSYRKITKSINSPAVEISFSGSNESHGIKRQKIHFVQDK